MGTNYYWCTNHCNQCGRNEKHHIGKRSGGWRFLFRAYPHGIVSDDYNPLTAPVMSWSDWQKVVVRAPEDRSDPLYKVTWGHIEDEYGDVIPPDDFEKIVEESRGEKLNHYDFCAREGYNTPSDFKDPDGWSFTSGEFS